MLNLKIETDNQAFEGNLKSEVARILKVVAKDLITSPSYAGAHSIEGTIHDINGNNVGNYKLTK